VAFGIQVDVEIVFSGSSQQKVLVRDAQAAAVRREVQRDKVAQQNEHQRSGRNRCEGGRKAALESV
jgi:hypothetical protein